MIAVLLLAAGAGAALQINLQLARSRELADAHRALLLQIARLDALALGFTAGEEAYVAPGQPDAPWLDRVTAITSEWTTTLATIRSAARSPEAPMKLQAIAEALSMATAADASARGYLQQEQDLMAADVIFGESREAIDAARASAAELAAAEGSSFETGRAGIEQQMLAVAGGAGALVVLGLLVLTPLPRAKADPDVPRMSTLGDLSLAPPPAQPLPAEPPAQAIDLAAVADLCAALSRVNSAAALPDMLARASALLDASGIIVWLAAGDELFAATSHGYNPRVIERLGAIPRDADNATADAWRTGEVRTVAGDVMSNGAIVAPMFAPDTCIGVLTAEVRRGRDQDAATHAVTMMVAAQLATVLAAWPAAPPARAAEG